MHARRALQLKRAGDDAVATDLSRARRVYKLAMRALARIESETRVAGLRARIGANAALAALDDCDVPAALALAEAAAGDDEELPGAWLRVAQARDAGGDEKGAGEALQRAVAIDKECAQRFQAWKRKRERSALWARLTGAR